MSIIDGLTDIVRRVLGTTNEAVVRRILPLAKQVAALEAQMQACEDSELRERSLKLRERVRNGGATLDSVQVEAFALVREAADRRLGMWNAVTNPKLGFPEDRWGSALSAIKAAREQLAAGTPMWEIDLPASAYKAIRDYAPHSVPPFRMRAHDVQVIGAAVLHQGKIAEMKTGEGKTLVASLTAYLNALSGRGVHIVTVNDYLASRDARWNEPTFRFLGISIGAIQAQVTTEKGVRQQSPDEKKQIYACDVVYGTNNEFGFDYLRDHLAKSLDDQVQTRRHFAIVDEVDSVLIDEARVPLIIAGPSTGRKEHYLQANEVAKQLQNIVDFEIDLKDRTVTLSDAGTDKATKLFGVANLYDTENMHLPHFLDNALKAHNLFLRDKEYLVSNNQIKIVDEHTGRTLEGRRWSDGLHQAIEAKEGVPIQDENQTYATITLQNLFRLYDKLAGMTGTAMTEANEFNAIYKLEVVAIPPNRPVVRNDLPDLIYGSSNEKYEAVIKEVEELHAIGQPVLVGTISVEVSEKLSELFTRKGIPHNVLNARQHAREAEIVKNAGNFGSVTIATNMAGRGTDIVLGKISAQEAFKHWIAHEIVPKRLKPDAPELDEACVDLWCKRYLDDKLIEQHKAQGHLEKLAVINRKRRELGLHPLPPPSSFRDGVDVRQIGGLRILGTERHDARRIDNQLRGRSGRQGDPGSTRFYLSLDDDLMKRFANQTMANLMRSMGLKDGIPIESRMVSRAVEKAQKRVEEFYYGIRKNLLEYDQVMNSQRSLIYKQRQQLLTGKDLEPFLLEIFGKYLDDLVQRSAADGTRGDALAQRLADEFDRQIGLKTTAAEIPVNQGGDACVAKLLEHVKAGIAGRRGEQGEAYPLVLRFVILEAIDRRWKDHIYFMEHMRHAIGLEGYAQKDPRLRYKEEGFRLFAQMHELIRGDVAHMFFRVQVQQQSAPSAPPPQAPAAVARLAAGGFQPVGAATPTTLGRPIEHKPNANDPCPCGSGRAYKQCHGT